jgi:hypothetical protein
LLTAGSVSAIRFGILHRNWNSLTASFEITRSGVLKEADCSGSVFLSEKGYVLSRRNSGEMDINSFELRRLGTVL